MFEGAAVSAEKIGCEIRHIVFFVPNVYRAFKITQDPNKFGDAKK